MTNVRAELHHVGKTEHGIVARLFEALADPDLLVVCGFCSRWIAANRLPNTRPSV
jgi:hypothetical protein